MVAYRQPVSRARISAVRGVNVDGVIRTLVSRGLVEECGSEPESGALLYRTTSVFLETRRAPIDRRNCPISPHCCLTFSHWRAFMTQSRVEG